MKRQTPELLEAVRLSFSMGVNTFSARTVRLLLGHIEALDSDVAQLQQERKKLCAMANQREDELLRQLADAREAKKAPLPRDVAMVLGDWQRWYTPESLAYDLFHPSDKNRGLDIVRTYAVMHLDNFLDALRHGYTVEQTPDDYVWDKYMALRNYGQHVEANLLENVIKHLGKKELFERMENVPRPITF